MTSKYHNQATDALKLALSKATADTVAGIHKASEILLELYKRGERHPFMRSGVLRWYSDIAQGNLSAHAVLAFGGVGTIIRKLIGMDLLQQQDLANGALVEIAEHDAEGKIVRGKKRILQMTTRQLDMVFDKGAVVSFERQKKILAARGKDVRRSSVAMTFRSDPDTGEIVCGQMRINLSDPGFITAVHELGFQIVRASRKAA